MDPEVILIGIAVFVLSALMIYLISVFGTKEKSYEEAIAEQKKRLEEEREKARNDKKAEKDKKKAKKTKEKPKDKPLPATEHEVKEHKMVNLELEPEIIEPFSDKPQKSSGKKKISKSILHNKDEKPLVAKETQEVIHFTATPKDDLELKHEHEKELRDKQKSVKKSEKHRQESHKEEKAVEDTIIVEKTTKLSAAVTSSVDDRHSTRKTKSATESAGVDTTKLIASVHAAPLNDNDTQTLIDILLNKQGGGSSVSAEWNKKSQKGDPVALMRKQLEEKERALQEEQQLAMSSSKQCKEFKQEMMKEKARYTALERQYQEKIAAQTQEIQALHSRMQSAHDQQLVDRGNLQSRIQQLERQAGDPSRLQQLSEENQHLRETLERTKAEAVPQAEFNSLRQKVSIMENELSSNVIKLNSAEKSKKALEVKLTKMEDEVKKAKSTETDSEGMWSKRLDEVNQQLRKSEAEKTSLTSKLRAAEKDCSTVKARLQELDKALSGNGSASKELEGKLKVAEVAKANAESTLKSTEKKLSDVEQQKSVLKQELETLKQDNRMLSEEIKTVKERQLGDGQEAPRKADGAPNGDIHTEAATNKMLLAEHEKIVSEKEAEIKKLMVEIESKKTETASLQEQVKTQIKKNNELREKNWKAMDALEKTEKSASDKIQKAVRDFKDQSALAVSEVEKNDKTVLQRLFPTISLSDKLGHMEWMSEFETQVSVHLTSLSNKCNNSANSDAKVKDLEGTVKALQSQLEDSKNNLSSQSAKLESKIKELEAQNKNLQSQTEDQKSSSSNKIVQLQSRITELEDNNKSLLAQVDEHKTSSSVQSAQSESRLKELEESNKLLQTQLEESKSTNINKSVESEAKINELTENNKSLQSQFEDFKASAQTESAKSDSRVKDLEANNKTLQSQVLKLETSNKTLQSQVEEYKISTQNTSGDAKVKELEEVNKKLESQVDDYLTVLKVTETKLEQLENSVESEEKKWQDKTQGLQIELEQAKQENASLKGEVVRAQGTEEALTELDFAYRCLEKSLNQITEEMKEKVLSLEGQLKISEDKCSQLQSQVNEADSRISTLLVSLEQSQTSSAGESNLLKEVTELKDTMEKEQKKSKELASQIVKLNGIIKTGHDALQQEQELVKKLKKEIEDKEKHSGTSANKEMNELKAKLAEKEKLLDREITSNKQLSQRLNAESGKK